MKSNYSKVRISLLTFTLGFAGVWMVDRLQAAWSDVPVNLPTVRSDEVLFVFPIEAKHLPFGRGCSCESFHDPNVQERLRLEAAKYGFVRGKR